MLCSVVVHRNYCEGLDACAFIEEGAARRFITESLEIISGLLESQGYDCDIVWQDENNVEISAAEGNIYYEWSLIMTELS